MKKILIGSVIALALVAGTASAATTVADIDALIAQLMAQKAALSGSTAGAFTTDLTVGSTGADVVRLQTWLESKGNLVMPAGVAKGYFGPLTKAGVAKYQAASGITPALGYFGPITRGKVNAEGSVATPATPGTPATPASPTVIATPGVEGTLSADQTNAGLPSSVYEAESMKGILAVELKAKNSDINVQRVKIDLGTDTKIYNKIFKKIYVTDGSTVLASSDLNSSTVVKDGSRYYITVAGFNWIIPKDAKKVLTIKADLWPTIDSGDLTSYTIRFAANGVRGVDGAGIDQYATDTTVTRSVTVAADLTESATLTASLNTSSPKKQDVVATAGSSENELDKLELLRFDVKAEKDNVLFTDLVTTIVKTGTGGAIASSTIYLYEGSTELDSATYSSGTATFTDFDYTIPRDTTKTFSIKADVRSANGTESRLQATIAASQLTAENSKGDGITESGSATGYTIGVRNVGPEVALVSKSITTAGAPQNNGVTTNVSTSTLSAVFTVKITARGGALTFGTNASTVPAFASTTNANVTGSFKIYRNSAYDGALSSYSTTTDYATPSGVTTSGLTESWTLTEGNSVEIPVTFRVLGRSASAALTDGVYAIGIEGIQWNTGAAGSAYVTNFMAGETDWRTAGVSFP